MRSVLYTVLLCCIMCLPADAARPTTLPAANPPRQDPANGVILFAGKIASDTTMVVSHLDRVEVSAWKLPSTIYRPAILYTPTGLTHSPYELQFRSEGLLEWKNVRLTLWTKEGKCVAAYGIDIKDGQVQVTPEAITPLRMTEEGSRPEKPLPFIPATQPRSLPWDK